MSWFIVETILTGELCLLNFFLDLLLELFEGFFHIRMWHRYPYGYLALQDEVKPLSFLSIPHHGGVLWKLLVFQPRTDQLDVLVFQLQLLPLLLTVLEELDFLDLGSKCPQLTRLTFVLWLLQYRLDSVEFQLLFLSRGI